MFITRAPMISLTLVSSLPQAHLESVPSGWPIDRDGAGADTAGSAEGVDMGSVGFRGDLDTKIEGMMGFAFSFEDGASAAKGVEGGARVEEKKVLMNVSREDFRVGR